MKFRFMMEDESAISFRMSPINPQFSFSVINEENNEIYNHRAGVLSVITNKGGIIGGSDGSCVISSIRNSIVYSS